MPETVVAFVRVTFVLRGATGEVSVLVFPSQNTAERAVSTLVIVVFAEDTAENAMVLCWTLSTRAVVGSTTA